MKLNNPGLSGQDKMSRLNRIVSPADSKKTTRVYSPVNLDNVTSDVILTGYRMERPRAFNIVDFYKPGENFSQGKYPCFENLGAGFLGFFLHGESLSRFLKKDGLSIAELLMDHKDELTGYLENLSAGQQFSTAQSYIAGFQENGKNIFYYYSDGQFSLCDTEYYSLSLDVFSRNTGILETPMMKAKTAVISGCGSVGSYIALELARAGVGKFLLIDQDTVSYANVCRHQCGIADVGRYKADAVADRIRLINPEAEIGIQTAMVENVASGVFDSFCGSDSIIIGCADNREGDLFACKIASHYRMPMVSVGFWERAFAGEVFYWIPERTELACYQCFTRALGDISGRQSVNRRFYTTETDLSRVTFMPGISVDIIFVTNVGVKIILDILNRNNAKYIPRLIDSLTQFTLIANTQKEEIGGPQAALFSYPLQVTTSIEVQKTADCRICNKKTDENANRS